MKPPRGARLGEYRSVGATSTSTSNSNIALEKLLSNPALGLYRPAAPGDSASSSPKGKAKLHEQDYEDLPANDDEEDPYDTMIKKKGTSGAVRKRKKAGATLADSDESVAPKPKRKVRQVPVKMDKH